MSREEIEDELIVKVFVIEEKLIELANIFKDIGRLLLRLQKCEG